MQYIVVMSDGGRVFLFKTAAGIKAFLLKKFFQVPVDGSSGTGTVGGILSLGTTTNILML